MCVHVVQYTACVSVVDTSIHTWSCSWNSQSHDLQSVAGMCLIEHIFPPESHLITELTLPQTKSHRPIVTKRLQSEQWARAVMTSITPRKLDQTSGSLTLWHVEEHTVVQTFRQVCMDTYRLTVQARSQPARAHFCSPSSSLLSHTSAVEAVQQEKKMLQNKSLGV